jgi:hypothetical protein
MGLPESRTLPDRAARGDDLDLVDLTEDSEPARRFVQGASVPPNVLPLSRERHTPMLPHSRGAPRRSSAAAAC